MLPYLAMLALPGVFALFGTKRAGLLLLAVLLVYWVMIGFRYQVGADWYNYANIYRVEQHIAWDDIPRHREPGFVFLNRIAGALGGGPILVNAVSALVFTGGLYLIAERCREPMLGIVAATPLLVVGLAMSGIRQAIALGIIFYLFARWERRSTPVRLAIVFIASLFHFSATFIAIFVAIAAKAPALIRGAAAITIGVLLVLVLKSSPEVMEGYSRLYVGPQSKLTAPGAAAQILVLTVPGILLLFFREPWARVNGDSRLYVSLAWASILALPAIAISSVGAYRFALYFWPMGIYVWAGMPALIENPTGRTFYRIVLVVCCFVLLIGWFLFANNSPAWLPYRNWLTQPTGASIVRHA